MKLQKTVLGAVAVAVVSGWIGAKPAWSGVPIVSLKMRTGITAPPTWSKAELGRVQLNSRGDQRTAKNRALYKINEAGIIRAEEFLTQAAPDSMAAMIYEQTLNSQPEKIDPNKSARQLRREYRQKLEDRGMAMLILNRILDHEAMKRKLEPEVSDARVAYILRAVLIQFGINLGKIATVTQPLDKVSLVGNLIAKDPCGRVEETVLAENVASRTDAEMFTWIKEDFDEKVASARQALKAQGVAEDEINRRIGTTTLTLEVDWSNGSGMGLGSELEAIHGGKDLGWPQVSIDSVTGTGANCRIYRAGEEQGIKMALKGAQFPRTVEELRTAIRSQLQLTYRPYLRMAAWRGLVTQAHPMASWEQMFSVTSSQMDRMYEALKGDFVEIVRNTGTFTEVRAEGVQASAFEARYLALLDQGEAAHQTEFNPTDESTLESEAGRNRWMNQMVAFRREIQAKAYATATAEFAAAIQGGQLKLSSLERKIERNTGDPQFGKPMGTLISFADQEAISVANVQFFTSRLVPRLSGTEGGNRSVIATMSDLSVVPVFKPKSDPLVEQILRGRVSARLQGRIFRKLAYDLFRLNPFKVTRSFCEDPNWPCSVVGDPTLAPRVLAEALFPETLYPGMTLGGSSGLPTSTLRDDAHFDRVQEISISDLERVFMLPND